jgi:hypothetical protein
LLPELDSLLAALPKGSRGQPRMNLMISKEGALFRLGRKQDYIDLAIAQLRSGELEHRGANYLWQNLHQRSWDPEMRLALQKNLSAQDPRAPATRLFVRDCLKSSGLGDVASAAQFRQQSPLAGLAADFFLTHPPFDEAAAKARPEQPVDLASLAYECSGAMTQPSGFWDKDGSWSQPFDSGSAWGAVIGVGAPKGLEVFDLSGCRKVELDLKLPAGTRYMVRLIESGAATPESASFKGVKGADGECWTFEPRRASGEWEKAVFLFSELLPVVFWGNQQGGQRLDAQAVTSLSIQIPGKQGAGKFQLRGIRFQP